MTIAIFLFFILYISSFSYIIGIDFGSQFIKIAYQPFNKPPDIVLDPSGKRKIENAVFFSDELRMYGTTAESSSMMKPEYVFIGMNEILGQGAESDRPASFQQRGFPYEFIQTERNTWSIKLLPGSGFPDIKSVSAEEVNAMILDYLISIVANEFGETSRDVVISIPSIFTQHQRQAILDSAELASINVISLVDQTTASAVTYALTRANEGIKKLIIYDIGGRYTEVSAVEIESKRDGLNFKRSVVILGKEAAEVGGYDFSNVISSMIADRFEQEFREDPRKDMKAMTRLRLNSRKYKEILSANREVLVNEPNLIGDNGVRYMMSREIFEEESSSIIDAISSPLKTLLNKLHMTIEEFSEVQLVGGSSRIPAVKNSIQYVIGDTPLLFNLNGDDSAALGCVYYASGGKFIRNKLEKVWDIPSYDVFTTIYRPQSDSWLHDDRDADDYIVSNNGRVPDFPIFAGKFGYEKKRTFSFPVRWDFRVLLHYDKHYSPPMNNVILPIKEYYIGNITDKIASIGNHIESNVSLTFQLDSYGMISLCTAELTSRFITQEDRLTYQRRMNSPFYRYGRRDDPMAVLRGRTATEPLPVTEIVENLELLPMTKRDKKESRRELREMMFRDEKTKRDQIAINDLEGSMFDVEMVMEESSFINHTTEEEKELLRKQLSDIREYVQRCHDKTVSFDASVMNPTLKAVNKFVKTVEKRIKEEDEEDL